LHAVEEAFIYLNQTFPCTQWKKHSYI